jgi:hypothetical protein
MKLAYAPFNVLLLAVFSLSGADWQVVFPVDKKKLRNVRKSHL